MSNRINTFGDQTSRRLLELANRSDVNSAPPAMRHRPNEGARFTPQNTFENTTAETIPAFGLMEVDTTTPLDVADNRFFVNVVKPTGDSSKAILVNGPRDVAAGERGQYQDAASHVIIRTDEGSGNVGPGSGWPAVSGSMFQVLGQVSATAPKTALCIRVNGQPQITFAAPSGGIPAASGYVAGFATCDILESDSGTWKDTGRTVTVYSLATEAICADGYRLGWAIWDGSNYIAVSQLCGDDRTYSAPDEIGAGGVDP